MPQVATLTESDLSFGKKITEQLKAAKFPFKGVLWLYDEEGDDWRLVVGSDLVDVKGPRETYLQLGKTISSVGGSDFQRLRITVVSPKSTLFTALRSVFANTADVEGARLQSTTVNGVPVSDAYLYEIR
ncbi:MAG: hypothetical protein WA672_15925 [Candidatus Angelobacter sp.]